MKKIIYFFFAFTLIGNFGFSQTPFGFVEKHGFGTNDGSITSMKTFKGKLYVGMGNSEADIYRSATGDPGSFSSVYTLYGRTKASCFEVTNDGGGYLFAAIIGSMGGGQLRNSIGGDQIAGPTPPSKIIRSADGVTWDDYYELPLGLSAQLEVKSINAFKGLGAVDSIYISYVDQVGNMHVVRNSIDANDFINSDSWQEVLDLNTQFGSSARITSGVVFNGKLYYTTTDNRLFETADGVTFIENTSFVTGMGNSSFASNNYVSSMAVYSGDLYFGTSNDNGGQLWKTNDGVVFDSLYSTPSFTEFTKLTTVGSKLWLILNIGNSFQIGSFNGTSYTTENTNEFGSMDIETDNNAAIEAFNNHLYVGVEHYGGGGLRYLNTPNQTLDMNSDGAQIWRACLVGNIPTVTINNGTDTTVCAGANVVLNAGAGFTSYLWFGNQTTQTISTNTIGYYAVTVVDAVGCRNTG